MNTLFNHTRQNDKGNRFSFAGVVNKETNSIQIGVAKCSTKDQFCKNNGRVISEGRALKNPLASIQIKEGNSPAYEFNMAVKDINLDKI